MRKSSDVRLGLPGALVVCAAWLACLADAGASEGASQTVRDMLRLDAQRAMEHERRQAAATPPGPAPARTRPPERLAVTAIFGLQGQRQVAMRIDGQPRLYREGHPWPREEPAGGARYRLDRIEGACVHLSRAPGGGMRIACMPLAGAVVAPAAPMDGHRPRPPAPVAMPPFPIMPSMSAGVPR